MKIWSESKTQINKHKNKYPRRRGCIPPTILTNLLCLGIFFLRSFRSWVYALINSFAHLEGADKSYPLSTSRLTEPIAVQRVNIELEKDLREHDGDNSLRPNSVLFISFKMLAGFLPTPQKEDLYLQRP